MPVSDGRGTMHEDRRSLFVQAHTKTMTVWLRSSIGRRVRIESALSLGDLKRTRAIFQWVGEVVLGTTTPAIATEVGFLKAEDGNTHVGRIDMVLANQESGETGALNLVRPGDSSRLLLR